MKKQFLFFATFIAVAFVSCSKEKIETQPTTQSDESTSQSRDGAAPANKASNNLPFPIIFIDPLKVGLLGRYEFDGNLKDTTGKLEDADPTIDRVLYTTDRKGQANKAIRFNGAYGLDIFDVPFTPDNCSVSFWVKDEMIEGPYWTTILSSSQAFNFIQNELEFNCSFWKSGYGIIQQVGTAPINGQWHHIAATRDNTALKLYIDGILIGASPSPAGSLTLTQFHNYLLGYGGGSYWQGSADDLRFYKRVLSPTDITKLANL